MEVAFLPTDGPLSLKDDSLKWKENRKTLLSKKDNIQNSVLHLAFSTDVPQINQQFWDVIMRVHTAVYEPLWPHSPTVGTLECFLPWSARSAHEAITDAPNQDPKLFFLFCRSSKIPEA